MPDRVNDFPPPTAPRPTAEAPAGNGPPKANDDIFFAAIQTTRMPMIVTDPRQPDNPIVFANNAFTQMTGYLHEDVIGRNCRFLQGPETSREAVEELRDAIAARHEIAIEMMNYRKDGSSFWNALFISPVFDQAGDLIYFFGSQLDVSRRRDAEDGLRQAQKMEALGQLTGGIAHDFNNLLTVTLGRIDFLQHELRSYPNPRVLTSLDMILKASQQSATLTQQLLAFARKQRLEGRVVSLNSLIETMDALTNRTLGGNVQIVTRLDPALATCRVDPIQAEMALLNVLINARDAMPQGGTITIETANQSIDGTGITAEEAMMPGSYASVSVTDTGEGMPPEVLKRVLEPFFTTKEEGKGSGLGLSMVYGFVKQSGGTVRINSDVGRGTTVRMTFPAEQQDQRQNGKPAASHRTEDGRARVQGGTETVLVVEDRPEVAATAREVLEDFGYRVLVAHNGTEALEKLDGGGRVHLLFSDLIMPGGINGVVLAREARERQPRLKVLLTTGYAETSLERRDAGGDEFEVISKPYRRSELARRVRTVLDGPSGID